MKELSSKFLSLLQYVPYIIDENPKILRFLNCFPISFKDMRYPIKYLGHAISNKGISLDPDKIKEIMEWHVPKEVSDVQSFMGIMGYYQKFGEGFLKITNPITSLQKKGNIFVWDLKCEESFNKLKKLLTTAPILRIIDPKKDSVVCTDSCNEGLGGVLTNEGQVINYE